MAVNSITFGGVNSADFGIYISGEGVFNAPKRDVEMIAIPGRDGELALDKGRFENIEVTYPAFNFEPNDYETFAKNLSDFRNAICSLRGYQRLTDTFHPDEYRMAAYIGGLEIKPIKYNTASEFSIIFDCKPQRYLTDGETPITLGEWGETETVSGDIVEIENDGIEAVKSLSVSLEPIQDLHGYNSPWVGTETDKVPYLKRSVSSIDTEIGNSQYDKLVGGTVAWNQLVAIPTSSATQTLNGVTLTDNRDGTYTLNNTASADANFAVIWDVSAVKGHVVMITGCPSGGSASTYYQYANLYDGSTWKADVKEYGSGIVIKNADVNKIRLYVHISSGTALSNKKYIPQAIDLTQMFGSTIADYTYALERATAGAGVAWFKKLFPKPYYAYNTGELKSVSGLVSHDMTGFNQWDEEWELGNINSSGVKYNDNTLIRTKNYIEVLPSTTYYDYVSQNVAIYLYFYDADKNYLGSYTSSNGTFTTPATCHYIMFKVNTAYGTTYNHDICINISWDGSRNGEYEPYELHSYPLDSDLTLRGIPKLDSSNNLYYDGDTYESDGTVTRKYGIVDLGTLNWIYDSPSTRFYTNDIQSTAQVPTDNYEVCNIVCAKYQTVSLNALWNSATGVIAISTAGSVSVRDAAYTSGPAFKTAMSGVYLVYELATPTTETADPYTNPQTIVAGGTEEYVSTGIVPVGHETTYANICPISGRTECDVYVSPTTSETDAEVYTTTLGRTVYGGSLDVTSGVLTVDRVTATYDGSENWTKYNGGSASAYAMEAPITNMKYEIQRATYISNYLEALSSVEAWGNYDAFIAANGSGNIKTGIRSITTVEEWKAYLAQNPLQVVYELATPQTYQLTGQDVELIEGNNYIWSDGNVTVEHGQNPNYLVNPTRFESSPLLMVEGYGNISFNGYDIDLEDAELGTVTIANRSTTTTVTIPQGLLNTGDTITVGETEFSWSISALNGRYFGKQEPTATDSNEAFSTTAPSLGLTERCPFTTIADAVTFSYGTASSVTNTATSELTLIGGSVTQLTVSGMQTISYDGDSTITFSHTATVSPSTDASASADGRTHGAVTGYSTISMLGHPTYIDCDYGEAYKYESGTLVSLNKYIDLGSDLPKLGVGENEVTVDDTITELKIEPRWWRI